MPAVDLLHRESVLAEPLEGETLERRSMSVFEVNDFGRFVWHDRTDAPVAAGYAGAQRRAGEPRPL